MKLSMLPRFANMRLFPDLLATESTMYLVTRQTGLVSKIRSCGLEHLLLEEFQRDLRYDALEHPAGLLVQSEDFSVSLGLCG